jgi:hypothetical protein
MTDGNNFLLPFKGVSAQSKNGEFDPATPGFNIFRLSFITRMAIGPGSCLPNIVIIYFNVRSQLTTEPLST